MSLPVERYRFTVEEYDRLGEVGILGEDDRVELIEGEIVMMTPIGSRHAACVSRLTRLLVRHYGDDGIVHVQNPIVLNERSEPQPDLCVLHPREDFYASAHPRPADILLAIEVADSSLGYDRGTKLPLYARTGVAEVWIIDLGREVVHVYRQPGADGYGERRIARRSDNLQLPQLAAEVAVANILP